MVFGELCQVLGTTGAPTPWGRCLKLCQVSAPMMELWVTVPVIGLAFDT